MEDFPMKCIQYIDTNQIVRISDKLAAVAVAENQAKYVKKELWKAEVRNQEVVENSQEKPKRRHNKKSKKQKLIDGE